MNFIASPTFSIFVVSAILRLDGLVESTLAGLVVPMRYSGAITGGRLRTSPMSLALASRTGRA